MRLQKLRAVAAFAVLLNLLLAPVSHTFAAVNQTDDDENILASINFDPKVDGFGFENFGNENRSWQDDLDTDDLIRLFGANAVCKTGTTAQNCVVKAAAREWLRQQLEGMDGGHCEGMAVTSLRLKSGLPFKGKTQAKTFQGADSPFKLKLDQQIENYIAYYFVTQTFDEVSRPSQATAAKGPVAVAQMLIEAMKAGKDTYSLGFYKFDNGRKFDGHAITPIAVEDAGEQYRIHVYDNNYPGETRYVVIDKAGKQTWKYVTSTNPNEPAAEYKGDITTKTLELTSTGLRDGKCFDAPFAEDETVKETNCGVESVKPNPAPPQPKPKPDEKKPAEDEDETEDVEIANGATTEFFLNGEGEMLVTAPDGKRVGYDPKTNKFYNEIAGANADQIVGGMGKDLPHYTLPFQANEKPYTIVFSGKFEDEESEFDFTYSAPGFTVGFDGVLLDPNETLTATITPDGSQISFTASADGETPEIYFAFDPADEEDDASYLVEIDGAQLEAGKTLTADFDLENGTLSFKDNDGNEDNYDIDLIRILPEGTEQKFEQDDLNLAGKSDNYEMNFGDWDGKSPVCFEQDEEGNGFADEECEPQKNEENDSDGEPDEDDGQAFVFPSPSFMFTNAAAGK